MIYSIAPYSMIFGAVDYPIGDASLQSIATCEGNRSQQILSTNPRDFLGMSSEDILKDSFQMNDDGNILKSDFIFHKICHRK